MRREYVTKKYVKLKDDKIKIDGTTLYRIVAVENFGDVREGELGGYIQTVKNLSQEGNCWIYDNAKAMGNSRMYDNSRMYGNSEMHDGSELHGNSEMYGDS